MKKILLGVVALIVLAAPALVGLVAEEHYNGLMSRLTALGLQVVHTDYRRGWFGSTAVTELQPALPATGARANSIETFSLRSRIIHGPLVMRSFALAEIVTELPQLSEISGSSDERAIHTLIHFNGAGRSDIDWPATDRVAADGSSRIRIGEIGGRLVFSAGGDEIDIWLEFSGGRITERDRILLEMGAFSLDSQTRPGASGVRLGSGSLRMERLTLRDRESAASVDMRGIEITGESREQQALVEAEANYRLEAIDLAGDSYGPGLLRLRVGRLAAPALARMQQALEALSRQPLSDMEMGMALLGVMSQTAAGVLSGDPLIAIAPLRIDTPEGVVEVEFSLQALDLKLADLANVSRLTNKLQGDLSLRLPEVLLQRALLEQSLRQLAATDGEQGAPPASEAPTAEVRAALEAQEEQRIALWLRQGLVERDGSSLTVVASLSSGLLSVNGKTIPLTIGR
ncbi:MAG: YdgA family protein [Gammaproteobacteria bacterium]|nr:YdgA family protein [Gammaproteobacteria bacterium]